MIYVLVQIIFQFYATKYLENSARGHTFALRKWGDKNNGKRGEINAFESVFKIF